MSNIKRTRTDRAVRAKGSRAAAFVLGRRAFAKVSAVEGIHVSKHLEADLHELADADAELRRDVLLEKYGTS